MPMEILIAGDLCPFRRVADLIDAKQYASVCRSVKPVVEAADYSLVNLECPVVEHPAQPIPKCGPNLKTTREVVDMVVCAGFKAVTLANNHILDYGEVGMADTLAALEHYGVDHVGAGRNLSAAQRTLYKQINGKSVAFVNCCEHEFSIAGETTPGANPLDPVQQYYAIRDARAKADFVIVIVHGGHEYYQLPSPRMQDLYRYFIDLGADAVINHHQHCFSGYERYHGKPIFYGLGNFCFDDALKRNSIWNEGYMVKLSLEQDIDFELIPYIQCNDTPDVQLCRGDDLRRFNERIDQLNRIIADRKQLADHHTRWMRETSGNYRMGFSPYPNRYLRAACEKGLLPAFMGRHKRLRLLNFIECEAHRDRVIDMLKHS